jgi:predicted TIM-barrel fold metal-dependent hydrolase
MERRGRDPRIVLRDGLRILTMGAWSRKVPSSYFDVNAKLKAMDSAGVAMAALSINDPGPEWFGDEGAAIAKIANDFIAAIVREHPARFFGLCVLPWQDPAKALRELNRSVLELGMRGFLLYTNLAGRFPDELPFRPVLARAAELGVPVLLHPAKPLTIDAVHGYEMTSSLGNMFENTIALTRLIMSGTLDALPQLKLVCPHLGGTLPFIIGRLDHQVMVLHRGPRLAQKPSEYLRRVWFDIASPLPAAVEFVRQLVGAERLLFASDHPWVEPRIIADTLEAAHLSPSDRKKIESENARQLFDLK